MAAKSGGWKCVYCSRSIMIEDQWSNCWNAAELHEGVRKEKHYHARGCPVRKGFDGLHPETELWDAGYAYAYADQVIHWWCRWRFSSSFLLGYRYGRAEIIKLGI